MRTIAALALTSLLSAISHAHAASQEYARGTACLAELPAGFALGSKQRFVNEIGETSCQPLLFQGNRVAWVERHGVSKREVFFVPCAIFTEPPPFRLETGEVFGGVLTELAVLRSLGEQLQRRSSSPPGWSLLSNPAFCGARVAYVQADAGTAWATIFDLERSAVVARSSLSESVPSSDYRHHFPQPVWSASGKAVTFWRAAADSPSVVVPAP